MYVVGVAARAGTLATRVITTNSAAKTKIRFRMKTLLLSIGFGAMGAPREKVPFPSSFGPSRPVKAKDAAASAVPETAHRGRRTTTGLYIGSNEEVLRGYARAVTAGGWPPASVKAYG
jgi:hypothetical protein